MPKWPKARERLRWAPAYVVAAAGGLLLLAVGSLVPDSWSWRSLLWVSVGLLLGMVLSPARRALARRWETRPASRLPDARLVVEEMSQALAGAVESEELIAVLVERLPEALGSQGAVLLLANEDGDLAFVGAQGIDPPSAIPLLSHRGGLVSRLLRATHPVPSADLVRSLSGTSLSDADRAWLELQSVALWVPLLRRRAMGANIFAHLEGLLLLGHPVTGTQLGAEDRRLVGTLAWGAAVAAENVKLVEALRRRAEEVNRLYSRLVQSREDERKRLSRELHDRVIQELLDLQYVAAEIPLGAGGERLTRLRDRLREMTDTIREVCADLRPSALDDLSLSLAIRGFVDDVRRKHGLRVSLKLPEDEDDLETLGEEARLSLFRVLQEALINAQRHSQAQQVDVVVLATDHEITLEVRDDGKGFVCPSSLGALVREGRFGLAGAQERMGSIGGRLEVDSRPGTGTVVRAFIPQHGPPGVS